MVTATYSGDAAFGVSRDTLTETVQGLQDVTGLVRVTRTLVRVRKGKKAAVNPLMQKVTVTNVGGADIIGPVYLVLDGLTGRVVLRNATGRSQTHVKPGDPFIILKPGILGTGQSVSATLIFHPLSRKMKIKAINFKTFVLAGPGGI